MLHTERTWDDRDSNPGSSFCKATVLTTEPPCCPNYKTERKVFSLHEVTVSLKLNDSLRVQGEDYKIFDDSIK